MAKYEITSLDRAVLARLTDTTPESSLWSYLTPTQLDEVVKHPAWVGFVDGELVGAGGVIRLWPGLAEAWIAVTPLAVRHPVFVVRQAQAFLTHVVDTYALHRIEAKIRADWSVARAFARALGFVYDATLTKYGPHGESFVLYSKVL